MGLLILEALFLIHFTRKHIHARTYAYNVITFLIKLCDYSNNYIFGRETVNVLPILQNRINFSRVFAVLLNIQKKSIKKKTKQLLQIMHHILKYDI